MKRLRTLAMVAIVAGISVFATVAINKISHMPKDTIKRHLVD